ncbi:zincin-like metallopeptidase domain-containing protein [Limobrevibacterium gyesilva]|uniref:Zincin-like metallopeptidase domain-containing protein n=1 Tax=Limobrevibacterium gyesilva TaxID=2991712 RepID=A0AA42CGM8_9PROT|nr:zincin-like metallopeptidase domain-containing protein [Limobrevibacterium gyesilva]MCW3476236.1 zincin-like metallopeptidase domain-containing protein [Limobrevibacterium gyesilva]
MANDYVEQVAGALVEQLKQGTAPWQKPWAPGERFMPYNPTTGNEYHGMNAVWLMSRAEPHGYADARWMTYRQAQDQNAQVRKGEKGTAIQFWKWQGLESVSDADGKPVLDESGEPVRRVVRYERPCVWAAVVFNAAQIDGLPPEPARPVPAEWERHKRADAILTRSGATIRHVPGDRAFYRLAEDAITLPERSQFRSGDRYYATALHELGHWTGHPSRLNRDMAHPFGSEGYAREELRAEIASLMLGERLGIGHDPGQHAAYVASWIRVLGSDPRELFRAAADAERIMRHIRAFEIEQERPGDRVQEPNALPSQGGSALLSGPNDIATAAPAVAEMRAPTRIREDHPAMQTSEDRTYLAVPYDEKDDAKALGAKWDPQAKAWYVPAGVDLEAFSPWLPARGQVHIAVDGDPREAFALALRESGLCIDGPPEMDGRMHRVPVDGDKGRERSGVYVAHLDGRPAGYIQNFRTGQRTTWKAPSRAAALDAQDRARMAAEVAQKRQERAAERERIYERTAQEVEAIWTTATPAQAHPYLADKGVAAHGLRQDAVGRLLVPVQDADGRLWSVQRIGPDGVKKFYEGGRAEGGHYVIGDLRPPGPVLIAEGYATTATLHKLSGMPAIAAFNAGNLVHVARTYRALYPDRVIYIAGDNDHGRAAQGKPNVGREKAEQAAAAIGGFTLLPSFAENDPGSDWNDLARSQGQDGARRQLLVAIAIAEREQQTREMAAGQAREQDHGQSRVIALAPDQGRTAEIELER